MATQAWSKLHTHTVSYIEGESLLGLACPSIALFPGSCAGEEEREPGTRLVQA